MIESAGLQPNDIDSISRALALTLQRQSAVMPYRFLMQDSIDRERARSYRKHAAYLRNLTRRRLRDTRRIGAPSNVKQKRRVVITRMSLLADFYSLLEQKAETLASQRRELLRTFDAEINPTMANATPHLSYLADMSDWLNLLRTDWKTAASPGATVLRELLQVVTDPACGWPIAT
jgi:Asp-tRNA(Asn)/Glu-tRNA(Gln) amidotransferase A subunit family amidase